MASYVKTVSTRNIVLESNTIKRSPDSERTHNLRKNTLDGIDDTISLKSA